MLIPSLSFVRITFALDANGILNASALEVSTGSKKEITIRNTSRMSSDEINTLTEISRKFDKDDEINQARTSAKNTLEEYCYDMEESIEEKDGLSEEAKLDACKAIAKVLNWAENNLSAAQADFESKYE